MTPWRREDEVRYRCYPSGKSALMRLAGYGLIGLGALLIVLRVPHWAWLALLGAGLILAGVVILRKQKEG